jgi:TonB family protein
MAVALSGAGAPAERQRATPAPVVSGAPARRGTPPMLLRASQYCFPDDERGGAYDFSDCFNNGDYPFEAWSAGEQGVVGVQLTFGAESRPTACEVTRSSGSTALDRATCDVLRARILGARHAGASGYVTGTITGEVRWVRPDEAPRDDRSTLLTYFSPDSYPFHARIYGEEGATSVQIRVGADGRVSDCVVIISSGSENLDLETCRIVRYRLRYKPARDADGTPIPGNDAARISWRLPRDE